METLHRGNVDNPEEAKRFLGIIEKHADRLSSIVEDLLSLSRIEQRDEAKAIKLEEGHVKDVFKSALQICCSKAEEKSINIKHIAQVHGGNVTVESTLGEGSVFTINLPQK